METNANQRVTCIANYPYEASEPDELSLRAGDVVRRVERLAGGWWRGELRGRTGMFPDNFCTVTTTTPTEHRGPAGGRCRAVFSYQPANPDELPLCVGDVLDVLGEVEEGWWQGRRAGRVGVFPSNFVVMVDSALASATTPAPAPVTEPAPALPPKPIKEQCLVLFPYTAVNDDELTLKEGDIVTIICKEAPDRGWWRGELNGRQGLFPDNFVRPLPAVAAEVEEKKPERPTKGGAANSTLYPLLNKYSEKTASVKELTTSKISMHKENSIGKESSTQITHTNKMESERIIHSEAGDGALDSQVKKPPVPAKKSPTPSGGGGVGGLLSGLKSKMMPSQDKDKDKEKDKEKEKDRERERSSSTVSSSSSGEWDKPDGAAGSRLANNANTFDHVERNSILNDPRAGRVKAPRRRPPSQALRDDTPPPAAPAASPPATTAPAPASAAAAAPLSNGHDAPADRNSTEKADEIKPRAREWEKHRAPWMDELKLNQAKKTSLGGEGRNSKGSTDRIVECGVEERRATHSMEMSRSTSSISSRISLIDSLEEKSSRQSLERKDNAAPAPAPAPPPAPAPAPPTSEPPRLNAHSPTAAGRTFTTLLDDVRKGSPPAPPAAAAPTGPPTAQLRHDPPHSPQKAERTHNYVTEKTERLNEVVRTTGGSLDKSSTVERVERASEDRPASGLGGLGGLGALGSTLERRRLGGQDPDRDRDGSAGLLAHLTLRISNLEKLLEVQNAKFTATLEEMSSRLSAETERRHVLQAQLDRLARAQDK